MTKRMLARLVPPLLLLAAAGCASTGSGYGVSRSGREASFRWDAKNDVTGTHCLIAGSVDLQLLLREVERKHVLGTCRDPKWAVGCFPKLEGAICLDLLTACENSILDRRFFFEVLADLEGLTQRATVGTARGDQRGNTELRNVEEC